MAGGVRDQTGGGEASVWHAHLQGRHGGPMCARVPLQHPPTRRHSLLRRLAHQVGTVPGLVYCSILIVGFSAPPPTRSFEIKFPLKFQTGLVKSETFFYNRKLTSIGKVFCLNKTFFTHFNYNCDRIRCFFVTQNGKLFIQNE